MATPPNPSTNSIQFSKISHYPHLPASNAPKVTFLAITQITEEMFESSKEAGPPPQPVKKKVIKELKPSTCWPAGQIETMSASVLFKKHPYAS